MHVLNYVELIFFVCFDLKFLRGKVGYLHLAVDFTNFVKT